MTFLRLATLVLLLAAGVARPAAAQSDELERAWASLKEAAEATSPAEEKRLAEGALPVLLARVAEDSVRCEDWFVLGEAQIRAGRPVEALRSLKSAEELSCDEADRLRLRAWALEYAPDGTRRGPGAQLRAAEEAWFRAAHLLREKPESGPVEIAGAIGNSAELALLRGAHDKAFERALAGLRIAPTQPQKESIALTLVAAGSHLIGEGAALDIVAGLVDDATLVRVTDVRLQRLKTELNERRHDPFVLASVSFYGLIAGTEYELYNSLRYLQEAVNLKDDLPDGWYLLGRTYEARQEPDAARDAYRRQMEVVRESPATRLATNSLAYLESEIPSSPEGAEWALERLDAEIAKTPDEAPFHDTRARLLWTLGRNEEACAAASTAAGLTKDDDARLEILRWQRAHDCPLGG